MLKVDHTFPSNLIPSWFEELCITEIIAFVYYNQHSVVGIVDQFMLWFDCFKYSSIQWSISDMRINQFNYSGQDLRQTSEVKT